MAKATAATDLATARERLFINWSHLEREIAHSGDQVAVTKKGDHHASTTEKSGSRSGAITGETDGAPGRHARRGRPRPRRRARTWPARSRRAFARKARHSPHRTAGPVASPSTLVALVEVTS